MSFSLAACQPKSPAPHPDNAAGTAASSAAPASGGSVAPVNSDAPARNAQFDIEKIPLSHAALPPFPYLAYPPGLDPSMFFTKKANFDSLYVVTGKQLRKVEGRVETHQFYLSDVTMSEAEARRNYENLITRMGGVKVNDATPSELAPGLADVTAANEEKTRFPGGTMTYDAYLVRKPDQLIWIVLMANESSVTTLVVADQAFKQTIAFVTADTMQSQLTAAGHVALYINFDTDKATIRPDAKPAMDEIVKLLEQNPALKLTIEGHTDNVGDSAHNKALSQQRADAVMAALITAGISKERLGAAGLGDTKPVTDNKDDVGRAKNRRVELVERA